MSAKLVEIVNEKTNEEVLKAAAAGAIGAMAITTQGKQNFYNLGALKACAEMLNAERMYLLNSNNGSKHEELNSGNFVNFQFQAEIFIFE